MSEANLFDIVRDEALLEALSRRVAVSDAQAHLGDDPLFVDLSAWTTDVDASLDRVLGVGTPQHEESLDTAEAADRVSGIAGRGGLHRAGRDGSSSESALSKVGRRSMRAGFAVAAVGTAMSFCGVAAAVNGGHLPALSSFRSSAAGTPGGGASVLADVPSATATDSRRAPAERTRKEEQPHDKLSGAVGTDGVAALPGSRPSTTRTSAPRPTLSDSDGSVGPARPTTPVSHEPSHHPESTSHNDNRGGTRTHTTPRPSSAHVTSQHHSSGHGSTPAQSTSHSGPGTSSPTSGPTATPSVPAPDKQNSSGPSASVPSRAATTGQKQVSRAATRRAVTSGSSSGRVAQEAVDAGSHAPTPK